MIAPIPAIETDPFNPREGVNIPDENINIQEVLESNADLSEYDVPSKMYIAFYTGYHTIFEKIFSGISPRNIDYPLGFVDFLREDQRLGEFAIDPSRLSLRLDDPNGMKALYDQSYSIDTSRKYTFNFFHEKKPDSQSIFVLNNKNFVCYDLTYIINLQGFNKLVKGTFYPID